MHGKRKRIRPDAVLSARRAEAFPGIGCITRPMRDKAPPKQLTFDLPLDPRYGREDFLVSPANEAPYGLVEAWPDWADTVLLLQGPPGSGKSHLASIWASRAHAWTAVLSK